MRRTELTVEHPNVTKESLRKALSLQQNARFGFRIAIVQDVINGKSISEISEERSVSRSAIYDIIERINKCGIDGLFDKPKSGRPTRLSTEQMEELVNTLKEAPTKHGYSQPRWDAPLLKLHINSKFNILYSVRHVQRIIKRLGFSLQRPRQELTKADLRAQTEFVEHLKKKLTN
jgi:transposase